jgi:hypothetical protein
LIISVIVIVCAVYWQSLLLPFIQDDWGLLSLFQTNDSITLLKHFLDYENKLLYRPLAQGYLLLIYKLFGPNPIPFHVMALIVHVVNSYIISLILNIIICDRLISNLTALVYAAAIPIHLDSLAWVVGINDVGGAFFFFMCILLFLKNKPIISAIFYFFGFFVKESLIPLPILLFSYPLLINSTAALKETILNKWKQTIPFLLAMGVVLTIKLSGISPFDLPTTHPYVIDLMGVHVIKNIIIYPVWMFQALLPFLSFKKHSYQFGMVLLLLYGILVVFRLRKEESQFRRILFFLVWLLIGLLPVLFLPNHTYRYYATYSLPAFIGSFFFLIKCAFLSFDVKRKAIVAILISINFFAVFGSILQGNQVYRDKLYQNTLSDGTNGLIRKAALVDIVCKGLKQYLPSAQSNSIIVIGNVDLWSFHKDSGPQFWYNDSTIRVYALRNLKYKEGKWYIENPIQNKLQAKTRPINKKIFLNPSMLFIYKVLNERLIRIDLKEFICQSANT